MTQAVFRDLAYNQLMTPVDSPGIDLDLTHDSKSFPTFRFKSTHDSAKSIWFWADSRFDPESFPYLLQRHGTIRQTTNHTGRGRMLMTRGAIAKSASETNWERGGGATAIPWLHDRDLRKRFRNGRGVCNHPGPFVQWWFNIPIT